MGSVITCCPRSPSKQDNVKTGTSDNSVYSTSNKTLSTTIQYKDFFYDIENAAVSPVNSFMYRESISDVPVSDNGLYKINGRSSQSYLLLISFFPISPLHTKTPRKVS